MEIVTTILLGILASATASVIFLFALFRLRPRFNISPYIADVNQDPDNPRFQIKVVNVGKRDAIEIRSVLMITTNRSVPGGTFVDQQLVSKQDHYLIPAYDPKDQDAMYAARFSYAEDLEALWKDDDRAYFRFVLIATDSLSGFTRLFRQDFHTRRASLIKGSHHFGKDLNVS